MTLKQHVDMWRGHAAAELAAIENREFRSVDTRVAISRIFGHNAPVQDAPKRKSSGLVDQPAWFRRVQERLGRQ